MLQGEHIKLTYLDSKGIAEPIRLALSIGGVPFEDNRVSYEEIADMRAAGKLPFGQVPVLEVSEDPGKVGLDGSSKKGPVVIGQSNAILRWAGARVGLATPAPGSYAALQLDSQLDALSDIHKALVPAWYKHACARSPVSGSFYPETVLSQAQSSAVLEALNSEILPARFALMEKVHANLAADVAANESEVESEGLGLEMYLCGRGLSVADLVLYCLVTGFKDTQKPFCEGIQPTVADQCPLLLRIVERVGAVTAVQRWEEFECGQW